MSDHLLKHQLLSRLNLTKPNESESVVGEGGDEFGALLQHGRDALPPQTLAHQGRGEARCRRPSALAHLSQLLNSVEFAQLL